MTRLAWRDTDEKRWRARLAIHGSVNLAALPDGKPAGQGSSGDHRGVARAR
jgi:hypothetical protein